jgi:hypothetical protein
VKHPLSLVAEHLAAALEALEDEHPELPEPIRLRAKEVLETLISWCEAMVLWCQGIVGGQPDA